MINETKSRIAMLECVRGSDFRTCSVLGGYLKAAYMFWEVSDSKECVV